ncbi:MAG: hypothetical protein HFJ24_01025 [Clostridia bacterium]|nr:hypothetical protein [Clostridia bacterium]MCI9274655.1 hypothetical protein [Clostridia bacterium]
MDEKTKIKFNVLAIICILVFSFVITPKTLQNDTFYTISIGEHIVENGIDREDPFAWTELKYTYPHWLYDVATYFVYNMGGMTGIYITTAVLSCILGIIIYITQVKVNKNNLFSFALTMLIMFLLKDFIAARAQLVTFILFILEILFVECFLSSNKKRYLVGLVVISALIANLHAAVFYVFFVLLLPYFAEYFIIKIRDSFFAHKLRIKLIKNKIEKIAKKGKNLEKIDALQEKLAKVEASFEKFKANSQRREENPYKIKLVRRDGVKWLILVAVICFASGLLTPIGDEPYTHIFKLLSGTTTQGISEHQPLVLASETNAIVVLVIMLSLLIFTDTKISLKDGFMLAGLTMLTFMTRRQISLLLIIGGLSISKMMCDFVNKYDKTGTDEFTHLMVSWKGKALTVLLLGLTAFSIYKGKINAEYINSNQYPVELANFMLEEKEKGNLDFNTMKLYNDYNYGSYLLYREIPVFIDSRADLYSPEFNEGCKIFDDYLSISALSTYYEDKFKDYSITHAMVYTNAKLNMFLRRDENYKELYKDKYFTLYERLSVDKEDA